MIFKLEALDPTALPLVAECARGLQRFGKTELIEKRAASPSDSADAYLTITAPDGHAIPYVCETKRRVEVSALAPITERLKRLAATQRMRPLLITSHVNDVLGERLRAEGIAYLDAAGNAWLVADPLVYIWVAGLKPAMQSQRVTRAFQSTGLQLIALLLSRPDAIEHNYRELAEQAGVSLGSISRILSDLRSLGFVRLVAPGRDSLVNRRRLLEHWEFGYATRLRPLLKPQAYRQAENLPVEQLPQRIPGTMREDVLVGGELAAALTTRHLRPQTATFHVRHNRPLLPMIQEMRLIPDRLGNIILLEQFGEMSAWHWPAHNDKSLVNPLLIYAELLQGSPDDRLKETAKLLFDQYLASIIND